MNMNPHAVEARERRDETANYLARGAPTRTITARELASRKLIDIQAAQKDLRALESAGRIQRRGLVHGSTVVWAWRCTPIPGRPCAPT